MANGLRIKVKVADLIKMVEKAKAADDKATARANEKYAADFEAWKAKLAEYVSKVTTENVDKLGQPHRPYPARSGTRRFDRDLTLLRHAADEVISITATSDFMRYIEKDA